MKIGILGGTFDPIHKGHLALARSALELLKLDFLYFVPALNPPLKDCGNLTSDKQRIAMIELCISGEPRFKISDCEIKRGGVSYTVDTVRYFREQYPPSHELYFVTGGDWGQRLEKWKEIETIFKLCHFVVAKRPGYETKQMPREVEYLDFIPLKISSTHIRNRIKKKKIDDLHITKPVLDYIVKQKLYEA
ncbi:MAG: nicotinate (nicotinamide) nucleotide adenylyltransferase [Omnitrophica bacterium RIFCSPLOWO2_12_FULL_44_17]|uniref:Probable nicotinate-nucleotide adenylyltransferase n=1 Tax=Candidatus Danuiimicrobium aquiferis TaxID=1801832 RepID=A0A1G1KRN4_9BACT|nr:MAG: nicotinate (nicotinamide) nucleotide adenylyltransferase [Omnitrophica bacterium RIFCSPHIGHO2_02_FULL_45_28]OGW91219.1 MAG: nicotinate (nicotinamide) nucleotide adenylyltransferase [Omnitrophica bacterium RIFCSPHIGHO2_12_FULL_44_12]OGW95620.1 MAG: nicotinate (nicotinamide) nucleotide adenylyltransferase [Omnitrophica bacterium RIFCSPLOWO2_12_FULL_44_17]OGX03667.1 MAG: nicotinate (nicotinamide) nucleotide adenylyltransferase [Omnitrophica bacterium RIFCSPLOWO2_02_FULL_44_11]